MKKRLRQKIPKLRSKKGMSLVELVVGITIIVIVFGSTLSAMTNGYSTTLYNADVNKSAVEGGSLNELLFQSISELGFYDKAEAQEYFFGAASNKSPNSDPGNAVHAAAKTFDSTVLYYDKNVFPAAGVETQYTIDLDASSKVQKGAKQYTIKGIYVQSYVYSSRGSLVNHSFIPYEHQDPG